MSFTLPDGSTPDANRDDSGRRVQIFSQGGALQGTFGKVVAGPYTHPFIRRHKVKIKGKKDRERMVEEKTRSGPWWMVHLEGYDRYVPFAEKELRFL